MKRRISLSEYAEFYIPVFSRPPNGNIFCYGRMCNECVFTEECNRNPIPNMKELEELKISNPEYFL